MKESAELRNLQRDHVKLGDVNRASVSSEARDTMNEIHIGSHH